MAAAINLQELEQELTRTKAMFEQWSAVMLSRAQGCKSSHTSKLLASKGGMLIVLHQHLATLQCGAANLRNTCVPAGEMAALTERYQRAAKQAAQVRQRR